jgi:hypothetical protein
MATRKPTPSDILDSVLVSGITRPVMLPIGSVRLDGGTQSRSSLDEVTVQRYMNVLTDGVEMRPIDVYFDGVDYWPWDGFHRTAARLRLGMTAVPAHVKQGTRRDAVLASLGANADHGLQRTEEDQRRAVIRALEDEEWSTWSDRKIAEVTGVSHPTVSKIRKEFLGEQKPPVESLSTGKKPKVERLSTNGKTPKKKALAPTPVPAWDELTWAVHDWAIAKLSERTRLFELRDMPATRQAGRQWGSLVSWLAECQIPATVGDMITSAGHVRRALDPALPDAVPYRKQSEPGYDDETNVVTPVAAKPTPVAVTWTVKSHSDGRKLLIHEKGGVQTRFVLSKSQALELSQKLAG